MPPPSSLKATFNIKSTIASFDGAAQADFKSKYAAYLNSKADVEGSITPANIALEISAGSINVKATVTLTTFGLTQALVTVLRAATATQLGASLGVEVNSISAVEAREVSADGTEKQISGGASGGSGPHPPPPYPPPSTPSTSTVATQQAAQMGGSDQNDNSTPVIIGVVVPVLIVGLIAACIVCLYFRRQRFQRITLGRATPLRKIRTTDSFKGIETLSTMHPDFACTSSTTAPTINLADLKAEDLAVVAEDEVAAKPDAVDSARAKARERAMLVAARN